MAVITAAMIFYNDTFKTAGGTSLTPQTGQLPYVSDSGATYTAHPYFPTVPSAVEIAAGTRMRGNAATPNVFIISRAAPSADHSMTCKVYIASTGTSDHTGVLCRLSTTVPTWYSLTINNGIVQLYSAVNNVYTLLGSVNISASAGPGTTFDLTLTCQVSTITGTVTRDSDGNYLTSGGTWQAAPANVFSLTDTSVPSGNNVGLYIGNNADTDTSGYQIASASGATPFAPTTPNFTSNTIDPGPTNDFAHGYNIGDLWANTALARAFQCRDVTANAARWMLLNRMVSVKDFGARGDAVQLGDATITLNMQNQSTVTSASANFTQADVGKTAIAIGLFNTPTTYLVTTIASVQSATQVILAGSWPFGTFSPPNTLVVYGTDDSQAVRAAISFAVSNGVRGVYFPAGNYLITQARALDPYVVWAPTVTNHGMGGSMSYPYQIIAHTTAGFTSAGYSAAPPSVLVGTTATGNSTLDNSNYNIVYWTAVPGAVSYDVLRWNPISMAWELCTNGGGVTGTTFNDQSNTTTSYTIPTNTVSGYSLVGDGPYVTTITFARPNGGNPIADEYLLYNYNEVAYANISGIYFTGTGFEQYLYNSSVVPNPNPVVSIRHWDCFWNNFWRCITNDGNQNTSEMLHIGCKCQGIGTLSTGADNTGWFYKIQNNAQSVDHYFIGCDLTTYDGTIFLINAGGNLHVEHFSSVIKNNATFLTVVGTGVIAQNNNNYSFRDGRIETYDATLLANIGAWCRVHFEDVWGLSFGTPPTMTGITPSSYGSSSGAGRIWIQFLGLAAGEVDFSNCYIPAGWTAVLASHSSNGSGIQADYSQAIRPTLRFETCELQYELFDGVTLAFFTGSGTNNIGALGHAIAKNCRNNAPGNVLSPIDAHLGRMVGYHGAADASYSHFYTYSPDQNGSLPTGGITTLSSAATQGAGSFTVANGANVPTVGVLTIAGDGTNSAENVVIYSVTGNTVDISGTLAHNHNAGSVLEYFAPTGYCYIPAGSFVKRIGIFWPGTGPSSNFQVQVKDSAGNILCDTGARSGTSPGTVWADCGVNVSSNAKKQFAILGFSTGRPPTLTTLSAAVTAGANSFTVANAAGLSAGMVVGIATDNVNAGELVTIGSVSGNTVTLYVGQVLQYSHNANSAVVMAAIPGGVFFEYY